MILQEETPLSLVEYALQDSTKNIIIQMYGSFFDKDDYSNEQFNNAIFKVESSGINVAWSNEAFELWLLYHFENIVTCITREKYFTKLNALFLKNNKGKYVKNRKDIYEIVTSIGDLQHAIHFANKQLEHFKNEESIAKKCPATTVNLLVERLIQYL